MFIYSLPILFTHMQWGSPIEFIFFTVFLYIVVFISTPFALSTEEGEHHLVALSELSFYKYLQCLWAGRLKLWLVFWPFFIFLNLVLFAIDSLAKQGSITVSSWDEIHFILLTPAIFWTISVWRNSINTYFRYWASAARLMTLSVFFEYALKLIIRRDYPRVLFDCQEIVLDYAACF